MKCKKVAEYCSVYEIAVLLHVLLLWNHYFVVDLCVIAAVLELVEVGIAMEERQLQLVLKVEEAILVVAEMMMMSVDGLRNLYFGACHLVVV